MSTIDDVFGPTGLLAQKFEGYQPRPGQIRGARACETIYQEPGILMADAPVGCGKSLMYLVPAIQSIARQLAGGNADGACAVVVTSNILLQEQLIKKDLPLLKSILPEEFTFEIAKGFSNYICKDKLDEIEAARLMGEVRNPEDADLLDELRVFPWERGDLSEYPIELPSHVKRLVTVPSEECLRKRCLHFDDCYPLQAKKRYGSARIVVTNYHLYAIDLAIRASGSDRGVLPNHRIAILDEAHNASDIFRKYFGTRATAGSIRNLTAELDATGKRAEKLGVPRKIDPSLKQQIARASDRYFQELADLKRSREYHSRLKVPGMVGGEELEKLLREAVTALHGASTRSPAEARDFLQKRAQSVEERAELIKNARDLTRDDWIYYVEGDARMELAGEPLNVGEYLRGALWERDAMPRSIVLCSGTLATGYGDDAFEFAAKELGIEECSEILIESPFDYSRSVLAIPDRLPDPTKQEFAEAVAETVVRVVRESEGRCMALFTSYRVLEAAHRRLLRERLPYPILRQGELPRAELIRKFKETPSILLGTESFWEGVDCPGEALVALVIDKIPFRHVEDPVLDAVKDRSRGKWTWFDEYYIPQALVKWRQGFGRLIRSVSDYGVVVCCDSRLVTKGYGKKFRKCLPRETLMSDTIDGLGEMLRDLKAGKELDLRRVA